MIDLSISDHTRADPSLTHDEVIDTFTYQKLKAADIAHRRVEEALLGYRRKELIRHHAFEETRAARQRTKGLTPRYVKHVLLKLISRVNR